MSNRKINKKIEEAAISTAIAGMLEEEGKNIQEEFDNMDKSEMVYPDEKHRHQFQSALNTAYRNWRISQFFKRIKVPVGRVITALAAVVIVFSVSVVSVEAFRVKFIDWLMGLSDTHTMLKSVNDNSIKYNNLGNLEGLSKNLSSKYVFKSIINENDCITATFQNGDYLFLLIQYSNKRNINIDNEDIEYSSSVVINEHDGILVEKNDTLNLTWTLGEYSYVIFTNDPDLSKDEIVVIAEDLQ